MNRTWRICAGVSLILAVALPVLRRQTQGTEQGYCALDGMRVTPETRVGVKLESGKRVEFCSIRCAEWWLQATGAKPVQVRVTDETTGEEMDASEATFVRSEVVIHPWSHERRHVFRLRQDAENHASTFRGRILEGENIPFSRL